MEPRAVLPAVAAGENARIPMNLHSPASQLPSKVVLLLIFGVLVVVFLVLFANWWMGGAG